MIAKASNNHLGAERAEEWLQAARAGVELYGDHPGVAFADLAAEVATEVRQLRAVQGALAVHAAERESTYRWVDPLALARSMPGLADVGGPALVACMGSPGRFRRGKQFRSFTGLAPRASETRARRRTKKVGKAPQKVLTGQSKPGARGAGTRGDLPALQPRPPPETLSTGGTRVRRRGSLDNRSSIGNQTAEIPSTRRWRCR